MAIEPGSDEDYYSDTLDGHVPIIGRGDDETSADPDLTEVRSDEFPSYFCERDGRLFHSHGSSPYPLPVDTPEQERLNVQHVILYRLIGANYVGPVRDVLAPVPERKKLVIDLCSGTGKWAMEMAREFPEAQFHGLDIVPIATRYPLPNVQFEIHDINVQCGWSNSSVDFVHARSISMAVRDYHSIVQEVGRILRPGGLFLSCEWGRYPAFHPSVGLSPPTHAPKACRFFNVLAEALFKSRGLRSVAPNVHSILESSGRFTNITVRQFMVPIGPWVSDPEVQKVGRAFRAALRKYVESVKPILREAGLAEGEVNEIADGYIEDLKTVRGMVSICHTVHARRV